MSQREIRSASTLKALAHPLRLAIMEHLTVRGPLTASELGVSLQENPSNCSWHLRKLAEHGLVEEVPTEGGRRRPWQVVSDGLTWDAAGSDDEFTQIQGEVQGLILRRQLDRYLAATEYLAKHRDSAWEEASTFHQYVAWMTAEELAQVQQQVRDVLTDAAGRLEVRMADPAQRPTAARLVEFMASGAFVVDPALPPLSESDSSGGEPAATAATGNPAPGLLDTIESEDRDV